MLIFYIELSNDIQIHKIDYNWDDDDDDCIICSPEKNTSSNKNNASI